MQFLFVEVWPYLDCLLAVVLMLSSLQLNTCQPNFAGKASQKKSDCLEYVIGPHGLSVTAEKIPGSVAQTLAQLCSLSETAAAHGLVCPFRPLRVSDAQLVCCNWAMLPTLGVRKT